MYRENIEKAHSYLTAALASSGYIDAMQAKSIISKAVVSKPTSILDRLWILLNPKIARKVHAIQLTISNFEHIRRQHNERYINKELRRRRSFFSSIEENPLDDQQARAIIADECNSLVIAGAGSGKTTTIVGKVKYLTECCNVNPSNILPISFTTKAAQSLKDRIKIEGINPRTFHSLGYSIVKQVESQDLNVLPADVYHIEGMYAGILSNLISDHRYSGLIADFFLHHLKQPRTAFEFTSEGGYYQYLRDQDINSYKQAVAKSSGNATFKKEQVKSAEECMIANFLLFNKVEYKYEEVYPFTTNKVYKPDFTITSNGQTYYLEHFDINREGKVPSFFAKDGLTRQQASEKYTKDMARKRQLHRDNGTHLLETYSYQLSESTLLEDLKSQLQQADIPLNPMTPTEILDIIKQSENREIDGFIDLLQTFTSLYKLSGQTIDELRVENRQKHAGNPLVMERVESFITIFNLVYEQYQSEMAKRSQIDFSDMLALATKYIENGDFVCPWEYIIVDEFQDTSMGTYRLLKAIRKQNPRIKLFCVGDDWQSIYRFAGSDLGLFVDFENYFGLTARSYIESTYRFGEPLIGVSGDFITKNPSQIKKNLKSPKKKQTTISVYQYKPKDSVAKVLVRALRGLERESGLTSSSTVLLLGRYKNDFKSIGNIPGRLKTNSRSRSKIVTYTLSRPEQQGQTIDMEFLTVHKAKGLEADFVIVLNCNSGTMGFPCLRADDPVLNLLLSASDQFENGEERRLFYVALTRAKEEVILLTDSTRQSRFILEFSNNQNDPSTKFCPQCKNGVLALQKGVTNNKPWAFWGCSNFIFGCEYKKWID